MARIPGAAVVAAFLLFGTRDADAFQPHSRVSATARPSRTMRPNGSELDMMSVFGRDVQVRVSEGDREKPLVACVDSGTICTVAENTDAVRPMHDAATEGRGRGGVAWDALVAWLPAILT